MTKYLYSYTKSSPSAQALAKELGATMVYHGETKDVPDGSKVINWGSGGMSKSFAARVKVINHPDAVSDAVDKITSFKAFKASNVPTVPFYLDLISAIKEAGSGILMCRRDTQGKDGEGLVMVDMSNTTGLLAQATCPLFTKFVHAKAEYRVNTTIDLCVGVQKKVQADGATITCDKVRTSSNGYGFHLCSAQEIPFGLRPVAKEALKALGLDFGGVDIIHTEDGRFLVLEVNTAPQLTPSMVKGYAEQLNAMYS